MSFSNAVHKASERTLRRIAEEGQLIATNRQHPRISEEQKERNALQDEWIQAQNEHRAREQAKQYTPFSERLRSWFQWR